MLRPFGVVALICGIALVSRGVALQTYVVDASRSSATIAVGKSGLLSFAAGHPHEVVAPSISGRLSIDPSDPEHSTVRLTIDASALKVTGKGESPDDVPKVQQTMASDQVLDVRRFPTIAFESSSVSAKTAGAANLDVIVNGRLTLHNVTRPISVPVSVRIGPNELTATGHFSLKQTDYGIKPVSVGGVVSVKDAVNISFTIVAQGASPSVVESR